jgi:hypothetical protein
MTTQPSQAAAHCKRDKRELPYTAVYCTKSCAPGENAPQRSVHFGDSPGNQHQANLWKKQILKPKGGLRTSREHTAMPSGTLWMASVAEIKYPK